MSKMSTDQRRFEVFVSSTYADLREARQRVTMTLLECDAFPTGMEIFPAADDDAWTLICRIIDRCDYYLLVIAGNYGSVNPASGLSYTEMEYDYAVSAGKPVMGFLHGNLGELRSDLCENTEERRAMLDNFREKVQKAKHVKYWKSSDELAGQVALTYNRFVHMYPATGWVRADQATTSESLKELLDAKSRIEQLEADLKKAETTAPAGTEVLAQGADEFVITYGLHATYREKREPTRGTIDKWTTHAVTWDSLFAGIAPQLLQEAEQADLRKRIEDFLLSEFLDENVDEIVEAVNTTKNVAIDVNEVVTAKVQIAEVTFGTILVQLMALGLIQRSDRKRSVSDNGNYWALTPYGERRTIQLRAIPKQGVSAPTTAADSPS